jgi:hypothetical protein
MIPNPNAYSVRNGFVVVAREYGLERLITSIYVIQAKGQPTRVGVNLAKHNRKGPEETMYAVFAKRGGAMGGVT